MKQKHNSFSMQIGLWLSAAILVSASSPFSNLFLPGDNDFFASPDIIPSLPYTNTGIDTTTYTAGEPQDLNLIACGGDPNVNRTAGEHSAWYSYTPTTTESVTVDTIGSNVGGDTTQFDTMIGVYLDIGGGELSQVDCNDDGAANGKSLVTVALGASRTYYFAASSFNGVTFGPARNSSAKLDVGPLAGEFDPGGDLVFNVTSNGEINPPFVLSSLRVNPSPTNLETVGFTVTFSESVTGVDTVAPFNDFALTTTGVSSAAVSGVSGSGSVYTVTVNTGSGDGTIRLNVVDNDSIVDIDVVGNPLGGIGPSNGNFNTGQTYTVTSLLNLFLPLILR